MIYSLYKPIKDNNIKKINALVHFFKKMYRIISISIFVFGMLFFPFLQYVVNSSLPLVELRGFYLLFLANTIASYIFVYRATLINADQKGYIVKGYQTAFLIVQMVAQIAVLYITKNYYIYLITQIVVTLLTNLCIGRKAKKIYPFITEKAISVSEKEKKSIYKDVKSIFVYKIGTTIINSTDNILISILIGTAFVGYYSNYNMVVTAIAGFLSAIIMAIYSSIGNLNAGENIDQKYEVFTSLLFLFHIITTFCTACFLLLMNPFVTSFFGSQYLLSNLMLIAIVLSFYLSYIATPVWVYRETLGMFDEAKKIMLVFAALNLILSIILGKLIGISGIIFATSISRLLSLAWYEPIILYKKVFHQKPMNYFIQQLKYCFTAGLVVLISYFVCNQLSGKFFIISIVKTGIVGIFTILLFSIFFYRSREYQYFLSKIRKLVKKKIV